MLKNYITIAFRNLWRFKEYSLINIIGLALGLTIAILIMLFITDELSYDQFHEKKDRIFKVVTRNPDGMGMETNSWPVAKRLADNYPEVEQAVYTRRVPPSMMVAFDGKRYEHAFFFAGEEFFQMFTFDFIEGSPDKTLTAPYTIVLTRDLKERYFGSAPALGKTLTLQDTLSFEVTGVIDNVPSNSHMQFDGLVSFSTYEQMDSDFSYTGGWGNFNVRNYVLLRENADIEELTAKAGPMYREQIGEFMDKMGVDFSVGFEPLSDIYLRSDLGNGFGPSGSIERVYLVGAIAAFVLLLACINYVNLSTARSVYRSREVGLRKIAGSSRSLIFWQFQVEVFVITLMSFALVALFIDLTLPQFNVLMGKAYELEALLTPQMLTGTLLLILAITFLAGFYPSRILSGYRPAEVLKTTMGSNRRGVNLRRTLVIFQFAVSGALVMATFIVIGQLHYMQEQDLGFDKEQVLVLDMTRVPGSYYEGIGTGLRQLSGVDRVTLTNALPGRPGWLGQWAYAEDQGENAEQVDTEYMAVDEHYLGALGLNLLAGRNFDPERQSDVDNGLIINETTVREMGWQTPQNAIGKRIVSPSGTPAGEVIGVVKDYHGLGLRENIWPQAMDYSPRRGRYFAVRFETGNTQDLVERTRSLWAGNLSDYTFEYFFLDDDFDRQYRNEQRLMDVFILFAVLTVIIAVIGLLGLVSFMVVSRTREIGIRKVLGAGEGRIVGLLSRDFMVLVLIANLIIIPLVWWGGNQWLDEFAFHGALNPLIFVFALIVSGLLAFAVVGLQTYFAARQNPVETLRST